MYMCLIDPHHRLSLTAMYFSKLSMQTWLTNHEIGNFNTTMKLNILRSGIITFSLH